MKTMVLDIGGTAIKSAIFENAKLYDIRETATQASLGGAHVMETAKKVIFSYKRQYNFSAIGISTAGPGRSGTRTHYICQSEHSRIYRHAHT